MPDFMPGTLALCGKNTGGKQGPSGDSAGEGGGGNHLCREINLWNLSVAYRNYLGSFHLFRRKDLPETTGRGDRFNLRRLPFLLMFQSLFQRDVDAFP